MQLCTVFFTDGFRGIPFVRAWDVLLLWLLCSESLIRNGFHQSTEEGPGSHCIKVLVALCYSQKPRQTDLRSAGEERGAVHAHESWGGSQLRSFPQNKFPTSNLGFTRQRRATGVECVSTEGQSNSSVLTPAARDLPGGYRRPVSHSERKEVVQKAASSHNSSPVPARRGPLTAFATYKQLSQWRSPSHFLQLTRLIHTSSASWPSCTTVPLLSAPPNTQLGARPHEDALHNHLSNAVPRSDRLLSPFSLSPPSALERASGVQMGLLSPKENKEKRNLCIGTSVTPVSTRDPSKENLSSLLQIFGPSKALLPWPLTKAPPACKYAGCKAGTFRGRDTSDNQSCFAFAHCSRCPLYPLERVEYCSKLKEEKNYLLLMQSTLHLKPEPEIPFRYSPSKGVRADAKTATPDESAPADEQAEAFTSERGTEGWWSGRGDDKHPAKASFLHVGGRSALRVHTRQWRHMPARVSEFRRQKREPATTEQWSNQVKGRQAVTVGDFTVPSLMETLEARPHTEWETPDVADDEANEWTERRVQLGAWKSEDYEGETGHNEEVLRTDLPMAELLKFEQSKIFRAQPAEMRSDLNKCAISATGVINLLIMFAFQPTRAQMSVETARQQLGAGVAPVEESEREGQDGGGAEGEESSGEDEDELDEGNTLHFAFAEQLSSSDKPGGMHTHSTSVRVSSLPPADAQEAAGRLSRSSHAVNVEGDRHCNHTREPDRLPSKSSSALLNPSTSASFAVKRTRACVTSRLCQRGPHASLLQTQDDSRQEGGDEEYEEDQPTKAAPLRRFAGRIKALFRRREKNDEVPEEPEQLYEQEEEEDARGSTESEAAKTGRKAAESRKKLFFRSVFKRKTARQKQELQETKKATNILARAPHVHLEMAVVSPAVRKCRKALEWSGHLRLSTVLHVQYFVPVRKDEVQGQLPAFINDALRIVLRCKSKQGCVVNRNLQSCVLVSCVKHKGVSREAAAASSKAAEALAKSQLKLAQIGTWGVMSEQERATRAAEFEKTVEEKQHEGEARQLRQLQQILSDQEQRQMVQQQLAKFSTTTPDTMQRRLLNVIGIRDLKTTSADSIAPPSIKEAHKSIESSSPVSPVSRRWLTPATVTAVSLGSAVALLAVGILYGCRF